MYATYAHSVKRHPFYTCPVYTTALHHCGDLLLKARDYNVHEFECILKPFVVRWNRGEVFLACNRYNRRGHETEELQYAAQCFIRAATPLIIEAWCARLSHNEAYSLCVGLRSGAQLRLGQTDIFVGGSQIKQLWERTHRPQRLAYFDR